MSEILQYLASNDGYLESTADLSNFAARASYYGLERTQLTRK